MFNFYKLASAWLLFYCIILFHSYVLAQTLDPNFNPLLKKASVPVYTCAVQADDKIIAGGIFSFAGNTPVNNIARFNKDGSLDTTFRIGSGTDAAVTQVILQEDGRILVAGEFTSFNGSPVKHIIRLNTDGTLDETFQAAIATQDPVHCFAVQSDEKIVIGGAIFGSILGAVRRLNSDGSLDETFDAGSGANGSIVSLTLQSDNKILVNGLFRKFHTADVKSLIRLNSNGSMDNTFSVGDGVTDFYGSLKTVLILPDGKIMLGGSFRNFDNISVNGIARLNTNGSIDNSFNIGASALFTGSNLVYSFLLQQDGSLIIGGEFVNFGGVEKKRLAKLTTSGIPDNTFNDNKVTNGFFYQLANQSNGSIIGVGMLLETATATLGVSRFDATGKLDAAFNQNHKLFGGSSVQAITQQKDGKILISGDFELVNKHLTRKVARLNKNGTTDSTFTAPALNDGLIYSIAVQEDGKILIAGNIYLNNYILRLQANGALDNSFHFMGISGSIHSIALQTDGKIILAGSFTYTNSSGSASRNIMRVNSNGSLDNTFNIGTGTFGGQNVISKVLLQPDNKILIAGMFESLNGINTGRIARLNTDGTLDQTFTTGTGADASINDIVLQPDNKIIIAGTFSSYNQTQRLYIARLHKNGLLDESFQPATPDGVILSLTLQGNGKLICAGYFSNFGGYARQKIARLTSLGNVDENYSATIGTASGITIPEELAFTVENNILVGGTFSSVNNTSRSGLAMLLPPPPTAPTSLEASLTPQTIITLQWQDNSDEETGFEIQRSTNPSSGYVTVFTTGANVTTYINKGLAGNTTYYYRVRAFNTGGVSDFTNETYLTTLPKFDQTITFIPLADQLFTQTPLALTASASSGLPIQYTVLQGPATVSGNSLIFSAGGKITVRASQPGNDDYNPAEAIAQTFCVLPPKPVITIIGSELSAIFTLTSSSTLGNQWFRDGQPIPGAVEQTYNITQAGSYLVRVTIDGCLNVEDATPITTTGNENNISMDIVKLYPNPASEKLTVDIPSGFSSQATITIYHLTGVKVAQYVITQKAVSDKSIIIDTHHLHTGRYIIYITDGKKGQSFPFIKK